MRFSFIMDGCAEELTDKEWKWLTLVLSLCQRAKTTST